MIASGADLLTELQLVRVAAKVRVEGQGDKVLGDVLGLYLGPGEPPGSIRGATPSGPRQRAAVSRREDHERLVLCYRLAARLRDVGQPQDLAPRAFTFLRFDRRQQVLPILRRNPGYCVVTTGEHGTDAEEQEGRQETFCDHMPRFLIVDETIRIVYRIAKDLELV